MTEFKPPPAPDLKRDIPKDHSFDPHALKPMSRALWASSMALGHALTAYRQISRLKSASVSPDGRLGGRGYVMPIKDARQKLFDACESLSSIADTLYDEIRAPHWKPRLAQLDEDDAEDVARFVGESGDILEDPEAEAEKEMQEVADDDTASELPNGGASEASEVKPVVKQARKFFASTLGDVPEPQAPAAPEDNNRAAAAPRLSLKERIVARHRSASSSLPVDSLGGPRVDHIGPAEGQGPWGSFNDDETSLDDTAREPEWDAFRRAESALPSDDTPTEGWDWGLGYGADGQGAGGYENPSGEGSGERGVWGPSSDLPGSFGGPVTEALGSAALPGDEAPPVARSDYYRGPKDNVVQSDSTLPGDGSPAWNDLDVSMPGTMTRSEDPQSLYVRWDPTDSGEDYA